MSKLFDEKREVLDRVFSTAPVEDETMFVGREEEVERCTQLLGQRGAHGVLFGERGVGKSSIANIVRVKLGDESCAKCSCLGTDDNERLWRRVFSEVRLRDVIEESDDEPHPPTLLPLSVILEEIDYSPNSVMDGLAQISPQKVLIILDEFDSLGKKFIRSDFVDILKYVSDELDGVNFLLVGVGNSIEELVRENASIDRNLRPIKVPQMEDREIAQIIHNGLNELGMTVQRSVAEGLVKLSKALPQNTHLICHEGCALALGASRTELAQSDIDGAVKRLEQWGKLI